MINNLILFFFFFFLLLNLPLSSSSDPFFNTCFPTKCGNLSITYPFYITNQQKSYCGYPGFEVACENDSTPYMNLSDSRYVIRDIWYQNQTFEVVNSVSEDRSSCSGSIRNLNLEKGLYEFVSNYTELMILTNCSKEILLRWVVSNCSDCDASGGQCGYDRSISQFQCYCSDRPYSYVCHKKPKLTLILGLGISGTMIILAAITLFVCRKKLKRRSINKFTSLWTKGALPNRNVDAFMKSYGSLALKRYTYTDIKKMSNSFKNKLGEGGYGRVYKGKLVDGRYVAIKVLKKLKGNGEEFINEVVSICRTNHVNVVTLSGFCFERNKQALVYEFLPNGSLEKFIVGASNPQQLPGETLLSIAVGIAKGLDYLHRGCNTRILHFDIKPHNILLDEKFCPKIADFGLARLFPKDQSHTSTIGARGTIGYIAPELCCRNFGGVSHKSDVYSFGMMVIDMVCGREDNSAQVQQSSELYFPQWIYNKLEAEEEVVLQGIMNDEENKLQRKMILVSLWCIQTYPSNRPSMNKVVEMLEGSLESLQMPPNPNLSSPLSSVFHSSLSTSQLTT